MLHEDSKNQSVVDSVTSRARLNSPPAPPLSPLSFHNESIMIESDHDSIALDINRDFSKSRVTISEQSRMERIQSKKRYNRAKKHKAKNKETHHHDSRSDGNNQNHNNHNSDEDDDEDGCGYNQSSDNSNKVWMSRQRMLTLLILSIAIISGLTIGGFFVGKAVVSSSSNRNHSNQQINHPSAPSSSADNNPAQKSDENGDDTVSPSNHPLVPSQLTNNIRSRKTRLRKNRNANSNQSKDDSNGDDNDSSSKIISDEEKQSKKDKNNDDDKKPTIKKRARKKAQRNAVSETIAVNIKRDINAAAPFVTEEEETEKEKEKHEEQTNGIHGESHLEDELSLNQNHMDEMEDERRTQIGEKDDVVSRPADWKPPLVYSGQGSDNDGNTKDDEEEEITPIYPIELPRQTGGSGSDEYRNANLAGRCLGVIRIWFCEDRDKAWKEAQEVGPMVWEEAKKQIPETVRWMKEHENSPWKHLSNEQQEWINSIGVYCQNMCTKEYWKEKSKSSGKAKKAISGKLKSYLPGPFMAFKENKHHLNPLNSVSDEQSKLARSALRKMIESIKSIDPFPCAVDLPMCDEENTSEICEIRFTDVAIMLRDVSRVLFDKNLNFYAPVPMSKLEESNPIPELCFPSKRDWTSWERMIGWWKSNMDALGRRPQKWVNGQFFRACNWAGIVYGTWVCFGTPAVVTAAAVAGVCTRGMPQISLASFQTLLGNLQTNLTPTQNSDLIRAFVAQYGFP